MLLLRRAVLSPRCWLPSTLSKPPCRPHSLLSFGCPRSHSLPPLKPRSCRSLASSTREQQTPELPTLHGKNLLSLASRARDSHPLDWSEGAAVAEETDQLDLMDPHYDLTTAKLSKLFSLFQPDGESV
jgi:hypothetical protein